MGQQKLRRMVVDLPTKILDENINIKKKFTIDGWKCLKKNKISKETAEWNCPVWKIDVHLYASIVCDG